jgi:hypothetical protein
MTRIRKDFCRKPLLDNMPALKNYHTRRQVTDNAKVVRYEKN